VNNGIRLKFWGVRGAIPTPCQENFAYGGNTACLEVEVPSGEVLVFDAGSGVRALGNSLMEGDQQKFRLFLTHFHWDHIQGIPFFAPVFARESEITFYSGRSPGTMLQALEGQMGAPYFPLDFDFLPSKLDFVQVKQQALEFDGTVVRSFPLNHPQGAFGFRIENGGQSVVFATDHEHGDRELDATLRRSAEGADILIYDAQYTPREYADKRGWGHSTWLEGVRVARDAGVKKLVLFHHDPQHNDEMMEKILGEAQDLFPNTEIATEGLDF
jgi:phosphoribosyl 1,2-cyclic phosphodiesterase